MNTISIFSTIVTFIFAYAVFRRWRYKKPMHLFLWGAGLIWYGLGVLGEAIMIFAYSDFVMKMWYLSGAMLTAAWLGQGSVYLLVRKRGVAHSLMALLLVASLASFVLVVFAPVNAQAAAAFDVSRPASEQYKEIMQRSGLLMGLTIALNIYGTLALVGGAIFSAFLFWRKKVLVNRMLGNVLIAAGALAPAMAGSLVKAGVIDLLYLSEFIGVVLMYLGFLQATAVNPVTEDVPAPQPVIKSR